MTLRKAALVLLALLACALAPRDARAEKIRNLCEIEIGRAHV